MKKIYITFSLLLITISLSFAQWTTLTSGVSNTLRAPYFINGFTGVVVGEAIDTNQSPILKTTDGGITWVSKISGTKNALRAVHFTDNNTGFAVGFAGTVLKTTDGGETWAPIVIGTALNLRSIDFPSPEIGYIAGDSGKVLKTTDGGTAWTAQTTPLIATQSIVNIRFYDTNTGYAAAGTGFTNGAVIKTTDGGTTWTSVYTNTQGLLGIAVIDANTAFAGGGNNVGGTEFIVRTTDGGANWDEVFDGTANSTFRGGEFISSTTGWFAGDLGELVKTEDGGNTWSNEVATINGLLGIQFPTADTGYATGAGGTIIKYTAACPTLPAISAINGATDVCSGGLANYSISSVEGADAYTWSAPSGSSYIFTDTEVVVTFGSTSGDITVTATNACDTVSLSLSVTVHPTPPIPTVTYLSGVLSSSAATGNQWYFDGTAIPGATDQNYTPTADGSYYVTVTDNFGCASSSSSFEVVGTGITEISMGTVLSAFPNPFDSYTVLSLPKNMFIENGSIQISDVRGMSIRNIKNLNGNEWLISRESIASGVYFYRLLDKNDNLINTGKLIAQ